MMSRVRGSHRYVQAFCDGNIPSASSVLASLAPLMRSDDSTSDEALLHALIVAGYGSCGGGDGQIEEVAKLGDQDCYSNGSHNTA